ncbi:DinB family protein [Tenacibaculum amylolyticum]|uniref:DinB family protein n=1 Tax=Tenacibaculum amylolyticum TaxID=104269 RepID=UPI003895D10B
MKATEIVLLNFKETRRRSVNLWKGIPSEFLHWKPDLDAMSCIEMVRHVLEAEHLFHTIIKNRGNLGSYVSPWNDLPFTNINDEILFSKPYQLAFYNMIASLKNIDLQNIIIRRSEVNQVKTLGDYLNRMVYHEAVHTGQLLAYLRTLQHQRPLIWD